MSQRQRDFDVVIIGSGFGGSVAALRLTEKGYRVAVIEAGRRFKDKDFPKTSWRLNKFLFAPKLGLYGIQRIDVLPDVLILSGAGVGGAHRFAVAHRLDARCIDERGQGVVGFGRVERTCVALVHQPQAGPHKAGIKGAAQVTAGDQL